jgi:hypothetical protein
MGFYFIPVITTGLILLILLESWLAKATEPLSDCSFQNKYSYGRYTRRKKYKKYYRKRQTKRHRYRSRSNPYGFGGGWGF